MALELALDRGVIDDRVAAVQGHAIEHVDEQPRPLDVGEELVPEPGALLAPSIRPGMSAITSCRPSPSSVPRTGFRVVNG